MNTTSHPAVLPQPGAIMAVTGGASGIGFATAQLWCARGGQVVLLDLNADQMKAAIGALNRDYGPGRARGVHCDVTDKASVDAAVDSIQTVEGRLDALVNSAGIARPTPAEHTTDEDWNVVVDIHLGGTMRISRSAFPLLAESGGAIVNLSSVASVVGMPHRLSYTTVKAGMGGLTRTLAVEWAPHGIRVNSVGPGYVDTPLNQALVDQGQLRADLIEARTPLKRFAQPVEIAEPIVFLCTSAASFITGHTLMADGGLTVDGAWYGHEQGIPNRRDS
ncbi:SDR family NAD(P)-dependent oxidoreductase [Citricoccus sp. NR2]|uniref:SDR family NAD(P)-dependent oxidoreductase n=1 Tax=Citricoccus sp. NR2 TaxID=3004095 RepID=UPI0022DD445C|nr:SDR family oxidoreductase [Citricoccus sp. NR2]WBL19392.1 SDR family oxidoreductase [Citricoccus sp. NR2]